MINIIRTVGGSFGTAVLTVVLERQIVANVPGATGRPRARWAAATPRRVAEPLAEAFGQTFWWAVGADRRSALDPGVPFCATSPDLGI